LTVGCGLSTAESGRWHGFEKGKETFHLEKAFGKWSLGMDPSLGGRNVVVSKLGLDFELVSDRRAKSVGCGWMEVERRGFDRKPFSVAQIKGLIGFSGAFRSWG
jgi:hypothetical protein